MDSFPLHLPPIYYIYCREITPFNSTRVHVHCRCTHINAILKAQCMHVQYCAIETGRENEITFHFSFIFPTCFTQIPQMGIF